MGNQVRYRSYTHDEGEVSFEINRVVNFNPESGVADTLSVFWRLQGELLVADGSDNQTTLSTAIAALEAAYSVQGGDLVWLLDSGAPSAHLIRSNATLGGTKVRYVDWVEGPGEYTNHRTYRIGLEAMYPLRTRSGLSGFRETIELFGGGRKVRFQESVRGLPRAQTVKRYTTYGARQFGTIVGLYGYAAFPLPIFRAAHLPDLDRKQSMSPTPQGIAGAYRYKDFPRTYAYEFASATPLFADPARWTI